MPSRIDESTYPPDEAGGHLDRLFGLTLEPFNRALLDGYQAAVSVTANHPVTTAGFYWWAETNRSLRDSLAPRGWKRDSIDNVPWTTSATGTSIVAVAGNESTGDPMAYPDTKNPRGDGQRAALNVNAQMYLDPVFEPPRPQVSRWLLLYQLVQEEAEDGTNLDVIHAEISLPLAVVRGRIVWWGERIILPCLDATPWVADDDDDEGEDDGHIEIPVERR